MVSTLIQKLMNDESTRNAAELEKLAAQEAGDGLLAWAP